MIGEGGEHLSAINTRWGAMIIEELVRLGTPLFCACPGSRSTPLTAAIAARPDLPQRMMVDERGAAFFALGVGRATGRPAVFITTSGTAMANAYPAVIEAERAGVPLLLLSTDRPAELRESGANQTIDQIKLFGDRVRWYAEILPPDGGFPSPAALTTLDEAVHRAVHPIPGPVHLNLQFREPLGPAEINRFPDDPRLARWKRSQAPWTTIETPPLAVGEPPRVLRAARRGLVVAGEGAGRAAVDLAEALGWPLYADVTACAGDSPLRLPMFDTLLNAKVFQQALSPDLILHVGGAVISKRYRRWISVNPPDHHVVLRADPRRHDPDHTVTHRIVADPTAAARQWKTTLSGDVDVAWRDRLLTAARVAWTATMTLLEDEPGLNEPRIARLVTAVAKGGPVFLGNSMPIRDADVFGVPMTASASNRGASGIDGLLATAAGWSTGQNQAVTALIGDLSTLHDLSSLAILARQQPPLRLVVVNNGGGGIFSFLPVVHLQPGFETHFATAHTLDFADIARGFGLLYRQPRDATALRAALEETIDQSVLIEVQTDRAQNAAHHRRLTRAAIDTLEKML